jgi:hypothetical protein
MARTPAVSRDSLSQDQKAAYDAFVEQKGRSADHGTRLSDVERPRCSITGIGTSQVLASRYFSLSPNLGVGHAPYRESERLRIHLERPAPAPAGRAAGLSDALIDNLRDNVALTELVADEAAVVDYGLELLSSNRAPRPLLTQPWPNSEPGAWSS